MASYEAKGNRPASGRAWPEVPPSIPPELAPAQRDRRGIIRRTLHPLIRTRIPNHGVQSSGARTSACGRGAAAPDSQVLDVILTQGTRTADGRWWADCEAILPTRYEHADGRSHATGAPTAISALSERITPFPARTTAKSPSTARSPGSGWWNNSTSTPRTPPPAVFTAATAGRPATSTPSSPPGNGRTPGPPGESRDATSAHLARSCPAITRPLFRGLCGLLHCPLRLEAVRPGRRGGVFGHRRVHPLGRRVPLFPAGPGCSSLSSAVSPAHS